MLATKIIFLKQYLWYKFEESKKRWKKKSCSISQTYQQGELIFLKLYYFQCHLFNVRLLRFLWDEYVENREKYIFSTL